MVEIPIDIDIPLTIASFIVMLVFYWISTRSPNIRHDPNKKDAQRPLYKILMDELDDHYAILQNLTIDADKKVIKIDIFIVSIYGVFVVSIKKYSGLIKGKRRADQWKQYTHSRLHPDLFGNPIHKNVILMREVENILHIPYEKQFQIVVFPRNARWKKRIDPIVMYDWEVPSFIKKQKKQLLSKQEVEAIYARLKSLNISRKISYSNL